MQVLHLPLQQLEQTLTRRRCLMCASVDFVTTIEAGLYTCPFCLVQTGVEHVITGTGDTKAWMCGQCRIPFRRGPSHSENTYKALVPQTYRYEDQQYNGVPQFMSVNDAAVTYPKIEVDRWGVLGELDSVLCDPDDDEEHIYPSDDEEKVGLLTVVPAGETTTTPVSGGKVLKWIGHISHYFNEHQTQLQTYLLKVIEEQQLELLDHLIETFPMYFTQTIQRREQDELLEAAIRSDNFVIYRQFVSLFKIEFDLVQLDDRGDVRGAYTKTYYRIYDICKKDKVSILHGLFGKTPGRIFPIGLFVAAMDLGQMECATYLFNNALPQVYEKTRMDLNWFNGKVNDVGELVLTLKTTKLDTKTSPSGPYIYP